MRNSGWLALGVVWAGLAAAGNVERVQVGNRISESVPAIPAALSEQLDRYTNTRGAGFSGWLADGSMLITTRFGDTNQVHRVAQPMGAREQLTFYREPVNLALTAPTANAAGFAFLRDVGGSEFWQLYHYDLGTRSARLLIDGGRSRNESPLWSHDGRQLAFSSTARNGRDSDIVLVDAGSGKRRTLLSAGGSWYPLDFSPDGKRLLVQRYVSINETYPGEVDLASGKLQLFPVDGGKAAITDMRFANDGRSVYYISDEASEFRSLRRHDPQADAPTLVSGDIPWDVTALELSADGRWLAFVSNEDGISRVHVRSIADQSTLSLPTLPVGVVGRIGFDHVGKRLAVTINSATSPSDVYVIDLEQRQLTRWTASEVGGLDASRFVEPSLVRYATFDRVEGEPRRIPAFYYRPRGDGPFPVVISIHGGPEAQALPVFSPLFQYLVNELNIAVLVPNVRGSAGYGKSYLLLDNGFQRKDSVKDIGALLDWIAAQPELDAQRVGVFGGSYGGYMVLASLVDYADRLRAGVDVVGISSFLTFLANTEEYRRDLRRAEYGDERDPTMHAFLDGIAPLRHADKIRSALFVAQGSNDPRVPASEAAQIVAAVRASGREVWYLEFTDEGHGFAKKANIDHYTAAMAMFWQRHLLAGDTAPQ